jgi:beta-glucanase (GH16 family)
VYPRRRARNAALGVAAALLLALALTSLDGQGPTFAEECDGDSLDRGKWVTEWSVYFGEDVDFMGDASQVRVADGICEIRAERKRTPSGRPWASALISTHGSFAQAYGRFEIRAKLPQGRGLWPAFWLLPERTRHGPPEIDVMEAWTNPPGSQSPDARSVSMSVHYGPDYESELKHTVWHRGRDFTAGFHDYAVEWRPGSVTMLVDGEARGRISRDVPEEPMYLIVNLAVGSETNGRPDESTPSPSRLLIDHVRVFE